MTEICEGRGLSTSQITARAAAFLHNCQSEKSASEHSV